jgi:hypothetical protein
MRLTHFLAVALASGFVIAGCGGDDNGDDGDGGGEPLTKEEFVAQVDAICQESDAELEALGGDVESRAAAEELVRNEVVPVLQKQLDDIGALTPPEGDEAEIQAFLDAAQEGVEEVQADPAVIFGGPEPEGFRKANDLGQQYGLTAACTGPAEPA